MNIVKASPKAKNIMRATCPKCEARMETTELLLIREPAGHIQMPEGIVRHDWNQRKCISCGVALVRFEHCLESELKEPCTVETRY